MVLALLLLFAAFLWMVILAPTVVSFGLSAAIAIAWCIRLEKDPETI